MKSLLLAFMLAALPAPSTRSVLSGGMASSPRTCSKGALYVANDMPLGQQVFVCGGGNTWFQMGMLGGSGALMMTKGALDINTAVLPRLAAANTFTALNTMAGGLSLATPDAQPQCSAPYRGTLWFLNNGPARDGVQACVFDGLQFSWIPIY